MAQMRSRREQVDAHKFITARMNQALVLANPDSVERPMRRIGVSIFASVMIMVLVFGGFAIAALLGKGNEPPAFNHIIFEKDTNAIFVYTSPSGQDDEDTKLWPVTNYTSALLLLQPYDGEPPTQNLKPESLSNYERGYTVGLENAPPSPPPPESLLHNENWNACSMPATAGGMSGRLMSQLVVENLEDADFLGTERFMLVESSENEDDVYVLWNDRKFKIEDMAVLDALSIQSGQMVTVKENVLHTIPSGLNMEAQIEPYFGDASDVSIDGTPLDYGDTIESQGKTYVLMQGEDGNEFAEIGDVSRSLLEQELDMSTLTGVGGNVTAEWGVQADYDEENFPSSLGDQETLSGDQPALCSVFDPSISFEEEVNDHNPKIAKFDLAPDTMRTAAQSVTLDAEGRIIGLVERDALTVLPPGSAAIVASKPLEGTTLEGVRYLVDSTGIKYGIVDEGETGSTQRLLGYGDVDPVGIPEPMLVMIGDGLDLDPRDARSQLDPTGEPPVYDTGEEEAEGGE